MAGITDILYSLLYYISLPIFYLLYFILILLRLVASPFIYLGNLTVQCFMLPVHVIAKFEVRHETSSLRIDIG